MHHRVGRAADRAVGADRVLERFARQAPWRCAGPRCTISTARLPTRCARRLRREIHRRIGGVLRQTDAERSPAMLAMVEAVPMVMQWPGETRHAGFRAHEIGERHLARLHRFAELPDRGARSRRRSRGTCRSASDRRMSAMVGRSQLAAPISSAGVVLSQPTSSTTPSIGLARIDSSTSMLARLRNSMRGRAAGSSRPSDIAGELDREAAGLVDAALHHLGQLA